MKAKFNGEAAYTQLKESDYEMILEGNGSDSGGKGGATMSMYFKLVATGDGGTEMNCSMTLSITGKLAQFGSRMIVAVNNKMFDQWAKNFVALLESSSSPGEHGSETNQNQEHNKAESKPVEVLPLAWSAVKGILGDKN